MSGNPTSSRDATRELIRRVEALLMFFDGHIARLTGDEAVTDLRTALAAAKAEIGDDNG